MMKQIHALPFSAAMLLLALAHVACGKAADPPRPAEKKEDAASGSAAKPTKSPGAVPEERVVVYYFHATHRCATCLGIEKTIAQTLEDRFPEELATGTLSFEEINYEAEAGKPYVEKFQLVFGTMVVARESQGKTGKWEKADKVWELADDPPALADYVEKSVRAFLSGGGKGN